MTVTILNAVVFLISGLVFAMGIVCMLTVEEEPEKIKHRILNKK
jgi:hypothetical protein